MAQRFAEQKGNAYRASHILASEYEDLYPEANTLRRIKCRLYEAIDKFEQGPRALQQEMAARHCRDDINTMALTDLITMASTYRSQLVTDAVGAAALCYDWFYLYQKNLPYSERDFLFGTPSHQRF